MPSIQADIEFLAALPLYEYEKPYLCLLPPDENIDPDEVALTNLEYEKHTNITINDMREHPELKMEECGFEYVESLSSCLQFATPANVDAYKLETQQLLQRHFAAEKVVTYEVKLRRNEDFRRRQFDLNDKLLVEGPAKGAHNGGPFLRLRMDRMAE